jgi:ubiquinone/menaquinone biosynthesis C-methylase UbiE
VLDVQRYESWFETPFGRRTDRVERRILADLLSGFDGAESLLDVGCGTGHFVDLWQSSGMAVVGLDISREMLQFAHRRHPGVPAVQGDATVLPFRDDSFDVVSLVTVLEFLPSPEAALREAERVARKGILLGVLNSLSPVAWWRRVRRSRTYRNARFLSPGGLEDLVRASLGGREVAVEGKTGLYPLECLDGLTQLPFGAFTGLSIRFK